MTEKGIKRLFTSPSILVVSENGVSGKGSVARYAAYWHAGTPLGFCPMQP
jgi:hypothetical protein